MSIITTPTDDRADLTIRTGHARRSRATRRPLVLPWASTGRFATAADEACLVAELESCGEAEPGGHRRADVTALLNTLRGGLNLGELLRQAPGLRPARLLDAHRDLETRRQWSASAWDAIVRDADHTTLATHGDEAAILLPAPIGHLRRIAHTSPDRLRGQILRTATAVDWAQAAVRQLERRLDAEGLDADEEAEIARRLYDQHDSCALAHDEYLPTRVGALVPTRVAALLGEHRQRDVESGAP